LIIYDDAIIAEAIDASPLLKLFQMLFCGMIVETPYFINNLSLRNHKIPHKTVV